MDLYISLYKGLLQLAGGGNFSIFLLSQVVGNVHVLVFIKIVRNVLDLVFKIDNGSITLKSLIVFMAL